MKIINYVLLIILICFVFILGVGMGGNVVRTKIADEKAEKFRCDNLINAYKLNDKFLIKLFSNGDDGLEKCQEFLANHWIEWGESSRPEWE